jgi:DNA mismatch repair protein MutS
MDTRAQTPVPAATPMMEQYVEIKAANPDSLLFYRMGDFYELFFDDAVRAAEALDIALTKRGEHQGQPIPMCGVPVHNAQNYLSRLIKPGFKVAVGEQMEDPAEAKKRGSKSVVKRAIARIVTPGTLTEDDLLDARSANRIAALARSPGGAFALAWAEVLDSTDVFIGVNALDYSGYPDCRPEYIAAYESMAREVRAVLARGRVGVHAYRS